MQNPATWLRGLFDSISLNQRLQEQESINKNLMVSLQALTDGDVLTYYTTTSSTHYTGNPYTTYKGKIDALKKKYEGSDAWGCGTTRAIIDTRAAFIIGAGVLPFALPQYKPEEVKRELAYIKDFIRYNNLDTILPRAWAREVEIEGKALIHLLPSTNNTIRTILIPYREKSYKITWDKANYDPFHYTKAIYEGTDPFDWGEADFVFARFGGLGNQVDETPSKVALALRNIEDLDKALWDWRKINHLYASPTPYFKAKDRVEASLVWDWIRGKNWRIGKAFVSTADFELIGSKGEGYASTKDEMETHVKAISGITGVPPHLLGYPDLLSNRSTADTLMESLVINTNEEKGVWVGVYDQLFKKVLAKANATFNLGFNPDCISAHIPFISAEKLRELKDVWLPLKEAEVIDLTTFLSHVPEIDREEVERRVKEEMDEKHRKELELLKMNKKESTNTPTNTKTGGQQNRGINNE